MPRIESYAQGTPSFVDLTTPDQDAAKVFYADLFGWEYDDRPLDAGGHYSMVRKGDGVVAGIGGQLPELAGHPAYWAVYVATDDVDVAAASVVEAGGVVEAGPIDVMQAGRMAAIQDPTGARVNLWTPRDSIGSEIVNEPGAPMWNELVTPDLETPRLPGSWTWAVA
ncbi:MAG TPA: VOC family protein [Nocardioides sp.]|nr:VOC family protein [Nocardioides sp.]